MLSKERLYNLYDCLNYIETNMIEGAIVEVGCYKGASVAFCRNFSKKKFMDLILLRDIQNPIVEKKIFGVLIKINYLRKRKIGAK